MARPHSAQSKIPLFSSLEEEAHFWDTHDSSEFDGEFEPVEVEVANPLGHLFLLRLDAELLTSLHVAARQAGVDLSTYATDILRDALTQRDRSVPPSS